MYAVGERIIRQGDSGASMFFLTDGEVVVSLKRAREKSNTAAHASIWRLLRRNVAYDR